MHRTKNIIKDMWVLLKLVCRWDNIMLLYNTHKEFKKDEHYSFLNLVKAIWLVAKDEKIVMHEGKFVISSFLPPMPSPSFMQLINAVPGKKSKFYEHTHAQRTAPISVFIAITDACGYKCWHCSKANRTKGKDLPLDQIQKAISDLQDMGTAIIGITGGDPLLRKDLVDIVKSIDERSISILYTTGQTYTLDKAKELKKAGLFSVGISLDHYDPKVFDDLRGVKGAYDIAVEAMKVSKKAGLYTMMQTVVRKQELSEEHIWKMIRLAEEIGVDEIRFLETMPSGRLLKVQEEDLLNIEERKVLIRMQKKANWYGCSVKVTTFAHTESFDLFGCGAGTQHSYIDSQGNLCPCDFVPMSFGNIQEKSVECLWNEMNKEFGVPRNMCFIMQNYHQISKAGESIPLSPNLSKSVCTSCNKNKNLPAFYTTLMGKTTYSDKLCFRNGMITGILGALGLWFYVFFMSSIGELGRDILYPWLAVIIVTGIIPSSYYVSKLFASFKIKNLFWGFVVGGCLAVMNAFIISLLATLIGGIDFEFYFIVLLMFIIPLSAFIGSIAGLIMTYKLRNH